MAQLLEYDSFPESDGFFYSSEETDFIIMGIYRIHPYVTTKQEQILSRGWNNLRMTNDTYIPIFQTFRLAETFIPIVI